jgi:hypothetical protein
MARSDDGGTPVPDQGTTAGDANVAGRDLHVHLESSEETRDDDRPSSSGNVAGVQVGSGNLQLNFSYSSSIRASDDDESSISEFKTNDSRHRGYVFISHVREDSDEVDALQRALEAAGIPVWRDKTNLWPGQDWRATVRAALASDSLAFIVLFSRNSVARPKSYMNEELLLAVDQLRLRRPADMRLIPVRLDDVDVPDLDLGGGRRLPSIQTADLFGADRDVQVERLVATVQRLLWQPTYRQTDKLSASSRASAAGAEVIPFARFTSTWNNSRSSVRRLSGSLLKQLRRLPEVLAQIIIPTEVIAAIRADPAKSRTDCERFIENEINRAYMTLGPPPGLDGLLSGEQSNDERG